jgi:hypothetical protein
VEAQEARGFLAQEARELLSQGLVTALVGEVASMLSDDDGIDLDYERAERLRSSNVQGGLAGLDFDFEDSELEVDPFESWGSDSLFETEAEDPFAAFDFGSDFGSSANSASEDSELEVDPFAPSFFNRLATSEQDCCDESFGR